MSEETGTQERTRPDWGLEPPQWTAEDPAVLGSAADEDARVEAAPEPVEDSTHKEAWRSEAANPWSLDEEDDDLAPPVVGGD
ncbi:hypothetical protein Afil01_20190 [Actinorhabdospora filicis]|uniref:Uncharacterized protein n=1 Tax=Actinorhabdospora filicis TaxID=1785913 RepID=A0A9W6W2N6_9ACTN|nr:hypothetical protein [Actinorhabdospora filicis]GLZ77212.1 hypothetical protein Afil01_20190 [Actinorhabdospora filicis]